MLEGLSSDWLSAWRFYLLLFALLITDYVHYSCFRYVNLNVEIFVQMDSGGKTQRKQRPFDFTKYNTRHVALKIAYLGWDYQVSY